MTRNDCETIVEVYRTLHEYEVSDVDLSGSDITEVRRKLEGVILSIMGQSASTVASVPVTVPDPDNYYDASIALCSNEPIPCSQTTATS